MSNVQNNKPAAKPLMSVRPAIAPKPAAPQTAAAKQGAGDELQVTRPGRAVQPTHMRMTALEQMKSDRPKFKNPDDYKNYVIKFRGYITNAKQDLEVAKNALAGEKQKMVDEESTSKEGKDLRAAQRVMDDTHKLYQAPVDRITGELSSARTALDDAIYPGKRRAAELNSQAAQLTNEIRNIDGESSDARNRIGQLETMKQRAAQERNQAQADKSAAQNDVARLEPQAPSQSELSSLRQRMNEAASRLQSAESQLSSANAKVSAKNTLNADIARLSSALDTIRSAESQIDSARSSASAYKGNVTRTQNKLNEAMALPETDTTKAAKVTAAKSSYDEAVSKYSAAEDKVRSLQGQISNFGSSASVQSQISSKRSQLSQYAGAESEVQSASSAKSSAQASYNDMKRRYDDGNSIASQIDAARNRLNQATHTISESSANFSSYTAQIQTLTISIDQLNDQSRTKTQARDRMISEANREGSRQNPESHPQVVAAKDRVATLTKDLNEAQQTYNQKTAAPKQDLAAKQEAFTNHMKPFREKVAEAERGVTAADQAQGKIIAELDKLKHSDLGWWKSFWWKLRYHFDVKDFWKQQGDQVAMAVKKEATSLA